MTGAMLDRLCAPKEPLEKVDPFKRVSVIGNEAAAPLYVLLHVGNDLFVGHGPRQVTQDCAPLEVGHGHREAQIEHLVHEATHGPSVFAYDPELSPSVVDRSGHDVEKSCAIQRALAIERGLDSNFHDRPTVFDLPRGVYETDEIHDRLRPICVIAFHDCSSCERSHGSYARDECKWKQNEFWSK
jgi:hypothetical protein